MKTRIVISPQAERDIESQLAYLSEENLDAAIRFCNASEHTFALISGMPEFGPVYHSDNPDLVGVRYFPVSGFEKILVFYRPSAETVDLIRVLHRARDIESILLFRLLKGC